MLPARREKQTNAERREENWPKKRGSSQWNGGKTTRGVGDKGGKMEMGAGTGVSDTCFNAYRSTGGCCIWVTLTLPSKSVFQSPSNALHCGVFKRRFTAAQDQRDHRRPVIFWYLARGKERRGEWRRRRRRRRKRGLRIRCFPLEFADGEAGNFYQRGNKGLWRWKGWLVETIYSSVFFFFFWKGVGGVSEEEDRMEVSVLRFRERKVKLL